MYDKNEPIKTTKQTTTEIALFALLDETMLILEQQTKQTNKN